MSDSKKLVSVYADQLKAISCQLFEDPAVDNADGISMLASFADHILKLAAGHQENVDPRTLDGHVAVLVPENMLGSLAEMLKPDNKQKDDNKNYKSYKISDVH